MQIKAYEIKNIIENEVFLLKKNKTALTIYKVVPKGRHNIHIIKGETQRINANHRKSG